jgi:hypothetical protein
VCSPSANGHRSEAHRQIHQRSTFHSRADHGFQAQSGRLCRQEVLRPSIRLFGFPFVLSVPMSFLRIRRSLGHSTLPAFARPAPAFRGWLAA